MLFSWGTYQFSLREAVVVFGTLGKLQQHFPDVDYNRPMQGDSQAVTAVER